MLQMISVHLMQNSDSFVGGIDTKVEGNAAGDGDKTVPVAADIQSTAIMH